VAKLPSGINCGRWWRARARRTTTEYTLDIHSDNWVVLTHTQRDTLPRRCPPPPYILVATPPAGFAILCLAPRRRTSPTLGPSFYHAFWTADGTGTQRRRAAYRAPTPPPGMDEAGLDDVDGRMKNA